MTKNHIEFVLSGYGVPFTDALADKLLEMFDEEAASYQHTINELNKALSDNKGEYIKKTDVLDKAVMETLSDYTEHDVVHIDEINKLPTYSIPKREKGEWIERRNKATGHIESVCSVCGADMRPEPYKAESED